VTGLCTKSRRGRPRDPGADARILDAASALLLDRGYERMTIDEVAERAGVGKATVYRRWASKDELAHDAFQRIFDVEVPVPDTGSLRDDLVAVYRSSLEFANTPTGQRFLLLVAAEASRDDRAAGVYLQMYDRRREIGRTMLRRAVDAGELRADLDLDETIGLLPGLLLMRALCRLPMPHPDEAERMVDTLLLGAARQTGSTSTRSVG
jgi:AcrR family transcriptional regulator